MESTNKITNLDLSENQIKVIKDKYLRNSPTVEDWLYNVCHNIALGDLIHSEQINKDEIFAGVNHKKMLHDFNGKVYTTYLLHNGLVTQDQLHQNFKKFVDALESVNKRNPEIIAETEKRFYDMLANFKFLPNSPTLMNAGRDLQQLSACYVLPVEDSIEGIYGAVTNMALIHKSGGGTGFSFSRLRPSNDVVKTTKGISSGPLSFMQIFDKSTEVVKQGGTRRGANMGILHYTHPNILDFIDMKKTPGVMENFNISVTIDDKFMNAVKNNEEYELINPRDKQVTGTLNAREVWKKLVHGAWETGDPGIILIDRINNTMSNPTPNLGEIESTNPCGEQPLLPYEPCNLGSINLAKFVKRDASNFDYDSLKECINDSIHFLDNVIDVNDYPLPQIEEMAKKTRRIGLGIMGWAEALVLLGIPYGSRDSLRKAEELMSFINEESLRASEKLAESRGVFPAWKNSIYDQSGQNFRGKQAFPRNSARTTIAPTGTIGITAGLQGAGIEPFFAVAYIRYNAAGIDALKRNETPKKEDTFFEVNPLFDKIAQENRYFGLTREELYTKINNNHKTLLGIKEVPERIQRLFLTAHDLSPEEHVLTQCAFQKYIDNAVSKTVNLRNEATVDDVEKVYMLAYENGAKGVTVYRDGSKQFQVLNIKDTPKEKKKEEKKDLPEFSDYYLIQTGHGPVHIHINYTEEGPTKVFVNITPAGTEISGLSTALAIILSKYFEFGGDPVRVLKHLNSVKSESPYGFGKNRIDSIPHAISVALKNHLIKTGKLVPAEGNGNATVNGAIGSPIGVNTPTGNNHGIATGFVNNTSINNNSVNNYSNNVNNLVKSVDQVIPKEKGHLYCSKCFSSNVGMVSGCSEPTCFDCGYSKCS